MANEARVFAEGASNAIVRQFTVADANAISKGALLIMSATRTGITHAAGAEQAIALGYVVEQKEASDGKTELGCQRTGVVEVYADGTIVTGDIVVAGTTANRVKTINNTMISAVDHKRIIGRALEGASDGGLLKVVLTLG